MQNEAEQLINSTMLDMIRVAMETYHSYIHCMTTVKMKLFFKWPEWSGQEDTPTYFP